MICGENFVLLVGKITYPSFKELDNGGFMFKARLAIPIPESAQQYQYVKVAAWGNLAEDLSLLPKNTFIRLHGHIEESSYNSECKFCKCSDKKYWTEVIIDNFIIY